MGTNLNRRNFILNSGGAAGLLIPAFSRAATPCPPPQVSVSGGTSASTACAVSRRYSTSFNATENPISEAGQWTNGGIFGKTNVQTGSGNAYGTMVSFNGTQFVDSCACLSGFGPNHEVTCTISNQGAVAGLEVEILLRADITPAHIFTYELDCVFSGGGISLVRWDMTSAKPNSYTVLRDHPPGEVAFNHGDQVYASAIGTVITCKYKRVGGSFFTLFTYDTAGDSVRYSTGNPGISFWNETGVASNQPKFAWSDFVANTL